MCVHVCMCVEYRFIAALFILFLEIFYIMQKKAIFQIVFRNGKDCCSYNIIYTSLTHTILYMFTNVQ